MLRHLLVFVIFSLFLTPVFAQTQADSVNRHPLVDTVAKHTPADSVSKQPLADTVIKHSSRKRKKISVKHPLIDSVSKHSAIDSVVKHPVIDSVSKHSAIDSVVKHPLIDGVPKHSVVDSVVKHPVIDSAAKKLPVNNSKKKLPVKITDKAPAINNVAIKHSPIKTLSDERYNTLLKGDDFDDMALVGAMNHYPLPDEALKYKVQIGLNPGQIMKLKDIAAELHRKKVEMGVNIINNEKMLDSLFHSKRVVDGTIIFYSNRYGLYLGEIRNAVLQACYKTENILSDDQIKRLEAARKGH
jgi:hypothetical protein